MLFPNMCPKSMQLNLCNSCSLSLLNRRWFFSKGVRREETEVRKKITCDCKLLQHLKKRLKTDKQAHAAHNSLLLVGVYLIVAPSGLGFSLATFRLLVHLLNL